MHRDNVGKYLERAVGGESYKIYLPEKLPPIPEINVQSLYSLLDKANAALGRLDGVRWVLPDPSLFVYMYVRKEAILSSQIEGTQSSLSDLFLFEVEEPPSVTLDDVTEVSQYVAAMNYGLERLQNFPLSLRLICEIHEKLMYQSRGWNKAPGEFRTSQNWIGGSRPGNAAFVPPPPEYIMELLGDLERFIHDQTVELPILIKIALVHVQFETIHPFLDGNGRLGRLLITFILCAEGILKEPLLYLSLYLKSNRQAYYQHLQSVRETGDWESWIAFFLEGIIQTSEQATQTAQQILTLFNNDQAKIADSGSSTVSVLTIYTHLKRFPVVTTAHIRKVLQINLPTVLRSLATLERLGIIKEVTGKLRHKQFVYSAYLDILIQGTEG